MPDNQTVLIQFQPIGKRTAVARGTSLLDAARSSGIALTSTCGGEGNCGQCQVIVMAGEVTPPTKDEARLLKHTSAGEGLQNRRRLACAAKALSNVTVEIPKDSIISGQRLQTNSVSGNFAVSEISVDPVVHAFHLELKSPTMDDVRSDFTRITDAVCRLQAQPVLWACPEVIRSIPKRARQSGWRITVFLRNDEIIGIGPYDAHPRGLAVDLGTTKIAAYLVDLETGNVLASSGKPNPQISYGEDVISRLNYVYHHPQGDLILARNVHETLKAMINELVEQTGAEREQIVDACIVGNTAMIHLLLRLPTQQLATAPYVAAVSDALDVRAAEIGLHIARGAYIYIPPGIGGYVGPDHLAMLMACTLDQTETLAIGIDIGTNTEISIHRPGTSFLTSVSCASGPAFEGAHVTEGMRAATGAIEKVRIQPDGIMVETVDDTAPVGLCGSGLIDAVAELYRCGLINRQGRLQRSDPRILDGEDGPRFLLIPAQHSGIGRDICISQKDIDQVQLAKGAIHAGLKILLDATASEDGAATSPEAVEEVLIAGAFGTFLNVENAIAMGLFPILPNARYRQVGNAALAGARWMLISQQERLRARQIQNNTRYLELSAHPRFQHAFALGMLFPKDAAFHTG